MEIIIVSRGTAYFVAIMLSIFSVVGTIGNLWTIVALGKSKLLKHSTTKLIISLAVSDLLMSCLIFPPMAQQHTRKYMIICSILVLYQFMTSITSN